MEFYDLPNFLDVAVQYRELYDFYFIESIVATSGTFSVKLPKHYFGLGITFTGKNSLRPVCGLLAFLL